MTKTTTASCACLIVAISVFVALELGVKSGNGVTPLVLESENATHGERAPGTATALGLSRQEVEAYHRDGFVIKRALFAPEEAAALLHMASSDAAVTGRAHGKLDASGFVSKLSLWNSCGVNIYGAAARAARMLDNAETLLSGPSHGGDAGEEAYHYHTKVMIKEPRVGGAWEWHQDYGYWYGNGNMFPRMLSAVIALNEHTEENGAMHLLKGSHKVGRVTHVTTGDQAGADEERVAQAQAMFEEVSALLRPGDVLFFHCNLFHASRRNTSPGPRWSMITAYNTRSNNPYREHHHPRYTPLDRWADSSLLRLADVGITEGDGTVFMRAAEDASAEGAG